MKFYRYIVCAFLFIGAAIAETININWINDGETYAQTTCEIDGDIILPTTPTKRGYTFAGWQKKYTRLEYIESTGTQWIDTGIPATHTLRVKMHYYSSVGRAMNSMFGTSKFVAGAAAKDSGYGWYAGQNTYWSNFDDDLDSALKPVSGDYILDFNKNIYNVKVNNNEHTYNHQMRTFMFSNIYIFTKNPYTSPDSNRAPASIRLYSFSIDNNDIPVRNLIPVKRNSDSAIGMYDTVSKQFFANQGEGEFIAGPVAENQNFNE